MFALVSAKCLGGAHFFLDTLYIQAQLSQRDRAMLCVIEYFANSLKVTDERII